MTKKEFVDRIGIQCSDNVFERFNDLYAASDLDKDAFCKTVTKQEVAMAMQWEIIDLKREVDDLQHRLMMVKAQRDDMTEKYHDALRQLVETKQELVSYKEMVAKIASAIIDR